jgi:hypothetical protein
MNNEPASIWNAEEVWQGKVSFAEKPLTPPPKLWLPS